MFGCQLVPMLRIMDPCGARQNWAIDRAVQGPREAWPIPGLSMDYQPSKSWGWSSFLMLCIYYNWLKSEEWLDLQIYSKLFSISLTVAFFELIMPGQL